MIIQQIRRWAVVNTTHFCVTRMNEERREWNMVLVVFFSHNVELHV